MFQFSKRILVTGIILIAIGMILLMQLNSAIPIGQSNMSDAEIQELLFNQRANSDLTNLAGITVGIGFLLVLISFGKNSKKGGTAPIKKTAE